MTNRFSFLKGYYQTMNSLSSRAILSLILACTLTCLSASSASIGVATAGGSFQANSLRVTGNTTLFDGSVIETGAAASRLRLNNGTQVLLATESRAKVYQGRLVLEKGGGQLQSSALYPLEARGLRIASASPDTVARVRLTGDSQVLVAALKGSVRVSNSTGVLVASLEPGTALNFDPQAGAAGPTRASGCLLLKEGKYLLTDETTHVTLQLQGAGLEKEAGNRVEITGAVDPAAPAMAGATQLINVHAVTRKGKGCSSLNTAKTPAPVPAAGTISGASRFSGTTVAIVGGVAAAAAIGGLAATGTIFGGEDNTISRSR